MTITAPRALADDNDKDKDHKAHEGKSGSDPMTESLQPLTGKKFEAVFLNQMIQHHRGAIEMAKMVSSHTKSPEVNGLAEKIDSTQAKEIGELTHWLKEWLGVEPMEMPNKMADMKMKAEMPKLEAAKDAEFDKMFLEMMIEHHAGAVRISSVVQQKSDRPELLKFAERVTKHQTAEIQQMKGWQAAWFKNSANSHCKRRLGFPWLPSRILLSTATTMRTVSPAKPSPCCATVTAAILFTRNRRNPEGRVFEMKATVQPLKGRCRWSRARVPASAKRWRGVWRPRELP